MKKVMIILTVVLMAGSVFAADPNSMAKPTERNPIEICLQPEIRTVTIKMKLPEGMIWSWVNDPDFVKTFREAFYDMIPQYVKRRLRKMLETATWEDATQIYGRDHK